jgi:hypothetical protein
MAHKPRDYKAEYARRKAKQSKPRDYKAEYARRLKRAEDQGYSVSVARGHPKKREIGLERARAIGTLPVVIGRNGHARKGFRHTPKTRREEFEERTGIPVGEIGLKVTRRDSFIETLLNLGFTEREAYTMWFS